jgi:hypothetical protein
MELADESAQWRALVLTLLKLGFCYHSGRLLLLLLLLLLFIIIKIISVHCV